MFRVIDAAGEAYTLRVPPMTFEFAKLGYWAFEFGNREKSSFLRVWINGAEAASLELGHPLQFVNHASGG